MPSTWIRSAARAHGGAPSRIASASSAAKSKLDLSPHARVSDPGRILSPQESSPTPTTADELSAVGMRVSVWHTLSGSCLDTSDWWPGKITDVKASKRGKGRYDINILLDDNGAKRSSTYPDEDLHVLRANDSVDSAPVNSSAVQTPTQETTSADGDESRTAGLVADVETPPPASQRRDSVDGVRGTPSGTPPTKLAQLPPGARGAHSGDDLPRDNDELPELSNIPSSPRAPRKADGALVSDRARQQQTTHCGAATPVRKPCGGRSAAPWVPCTSERRGHQVSRLAIKGLMLPKLLDDETSKKKMTDAEPTLEVLSKWRNSPVVPFDSEKRAAAFCADALAESSACAESAAAAVVTIKNDLCRRCHLTWDGACVPGLSKSGKSRAGRLSRASARAP